MPSFRTVAAALAAVAVAGVQATEHELPPCLDPFQPFVYSGCFRDLGNPSALVWRTPLDQQNMTVETCTSACKGNGFRYAGLAYYGVCYCGQTVNGPELDESQCSYPCTGDKSQTCGGDNILSIYTDPTFLPLDEAKVEDYDALGCYTDDSPLGRALTYRQDIEGPLTTEKCLKKCRDGGFPFAGTEYASECWCGVVIGNNTSPAPADQCNMACSGDSSETCGGPGRLSLYVADELQSLEPCGYEPPQQPSSALPSSAVPSSSAPASSAPASSAPVSSAPVSSAPVSSAPPASSAPASSEPAVTTPPPTVAPPVTPTTTSSSVCVTTTTVPNPCEYKCGNWCSDPLPDFKDVSSCKSGYSNCKLQVASCFKHAGWPGSLECFGFSDWCYSLERYCSTTWKGWSKPNFCKAKPPKSSVRPSITTVITTTCPPAPTPTTTKPATTAKPTTTKPATTTVTQCPIPTVSNICKQPSNWIHGYGPNNPVGGIELPVVTCNDLLDQHSKYPFKLYSEPDSRKCKGYSRTSVPNACADACKEQYEDCLDVYVETCKRGGKGWKRSDEASNYFVEKRTFGWGWNDPASKAKEKCKAQYNDCLSVNRGASASNKCTKFATGPW